MYWVFSRTTQPELNGRSFPELVTCCWTCCGVYAFAVGANVTVLPAAVAPAIAIASIRFFWLEAIFPYIPLDNGSASAGELPAEGQTSKTLMQ